MKIIQFLILAVCSFNILTGEERGSSAPYISGDSFRAYCDLIYDELDRSLHPSQVKEGDTIFIKTDFFDDFFQQVHPNISARYIIVSHNSDYHIPGKFAPYLDDDKIIAWFGQNLENCTHPKVHPIPIGIANKCWEHGNTKLINEIQQIETGLQKSIFLYMNFTVGTYKNEREMVADKFRDKSYCVISEPKGYRNYLLDLAQATFVLSPRGNGLDCHRTWESLLMGAIPIVKTSSLDPLFEDLPVLIINDWNEVDYDFLVTNYRLMANRVYNMEKAYFSYWAKLIDSYKTSESE